MVYNLEMFVNMSERRKIPKIRLKLGPPVKKGNCLDEHSSNSGHMPGLRGGPAFTLDSPGADLFPRRTPLYVFLATIVFRLYYVSQRKNWWTLHPDEYYQTLEVAHSEVYGYGFRSYEYLPPPSGNLNPAEEQEEMVGMYSTRSFLVPRIFMLAFHLAEALGIHDQPFLVGKMFHAAIGSLLPLSIYRFGHVLYQSHDVASIASLLCAFSVHLTVFGTHTLINSFLSPLLFWAASLSMEVILYGSGESTVKTRNIIQRKSMRLRRPKVEPKLVTAKERNEEDELSSRDNLLYTFSCFILGLICYMEPEQIILIFLLFSPLIFTIEDRSTGFILTVIKAGEGFFLGVIVGGFEDYYSYGQLFCSLRQWFRLQFHIYYSPFVAHPHITTRYCYHIFLFNASTALLLACVFALLLRYLLSKTYREGCGNKHTVDICLTITVTMLQLYFSLRGRKELRFLQDHTALLLLLEASAAHAMLLELIPQKIPPLRKLQRPIIVLLGMLYLISTYVSYPVAKNRSDLQWIYPREWDSNHINSCLYYVGTREDVTGVYLSRRFHITGGFTLLHKNVPVVALISQDYGEFSESSRKIIASVNPLYSRTNLSLVILSRMSDYIDSHNHFYLYKLLLEKVHYNYIIIRTRNEFLAAGFHEVYRSGSMRVLKRVVDTRSERALERLAGILPVGIDARILELEGKWLLTVGRLDKAVSRLEKAIQIDTSREEAYQMLALAYVKMGDLPAAIRVQTLCNKYHDFGKCFNTERRVLILPIRNELYVDDADFTDDGDGDGDDGEYDDDNEY